MNKGLRVEDLRFIELRKEVNQHVIMEQRSENDVLSYLER